MADNLTHEKRKKVMSSIRGRDTKPELVLWKHLDHRKFRRYPLVSGRPDFGNISRKIALFVDGCFWHGCPKCYKPPETRADFWSNKVKRNTEHDNKINKLLRDSGFEVLRFWEHEILKNPHRVADLVMEVWHARIR